jgi:hypothetical protein
MLNTNLTAAIATTILAAAAPAQVLESFSVDHSDPNNSWPTANQFGWNVELDGEWLAVNDDIDRVMSPGGEVTVGTVHMFRRMLAGWEFVQYILPPVLPMPGAPHSLFGRSISISGDRMAIGGQMDHVNNLAGTVWMYEFNGVEWVLDSRLDPTLQRNFMGFGTWLGFQGEDLYVSLVRAGLQDPQAPNLWSGEVHRFVAGAQGWNLAEVITPSSNSFVPHWCSSFFTVGHGVLVMRCAEGTNQLIEPYLRIFEGGPGAWTETTLIDGLYEVSVASTYGRAMGIWGDWLAVGNGVMSYNPFWPPSWHSEVLMYRRSGPGNWTLAQRLEASDGWFGSLGGIETSDVFGEALDFDDGRLVVGAYQGRNGLGQRGNGSAYLFEFDGTSWVETRKLSTVRLEDPSYTGRGWFGTSVTIDGSTIAVGDPLAPLAHAPTGTRIGRAYVYEENVAEVICDGVPNAFNRPALLEAWGSNHAHSGVLELRGIDLPPFAAAILITGSSSTFIANPAGSTGNLCVTGGTLRLGFGFADLGGLVGWSFELPDPGTVGAFPVAPGTTRYFQIWYRDGGTVPTSNFSDAIAVEFR